MFENMTYPVIMQRMEDRVAEQFPDVDMREGSVIFNALAPAAMELSILYNQLDNVLKESFVSTASREYLFRACEQMGIDTSQFAPTKGIHKARFNIPVPIGSRWNCDKFNYVVLEQVETTDGEDETVFVYLMQCETPGTEPNNVIGVLTPIDFVSNALTYAALVEVAIYGEDEASDSEIRDMYQLYITDTLVDGNIAQYYYWAETFDGIGKAKVFPLWDGVNTVKVSILNYLYERANEELVDAFQDYLDPGITGMGDGVAPIGAFVTVDTPAAKDITISADIKLLPGYEEEQADYIDEVVSVYFRDLNFVKNTVPYLGIGAAVLGTEGVDSVSNLLVNGGTQDIPLGENEVPELAATTWTVVTDD